MMEQRLDIQYYLDEDEVKDIVITDLQEYILTLTNFLKTPDYEDAKIDAKNVIHLKAVLKAYMDRQEYKDFIKSL
jgi:hypothetical protein